MVQDGALWFNMCVESMCAYSKHGLSDSICAFVKNLSNYSKTCYASSHINIDSIFLKNL